MVENTAWSGPRPEPYSGLPLKRFPIDLRMIFDGSKTIFIAFSMVQLVYIGYKYTRIWLAFGRILQKNHNIYALIIGVSHHTRHLCLIASGIIYLQDIIITDGKFFSNTKFYRKMLLF